MAFPGTATSKAAANSSEAQPPPIVIEQFELEEKKTVSDLKKPLGLRGVGLGKWFGFGVVWSCFLFDIILVNRPAGVYFCSSMHWSYLEALTSRVQNSLLSQMAAVSG